MSCWCSLRLCPRSTQNCFSASDLFWNMALYKCLYLLTYSRSSWVALLDKPYYDFLLVLCCFCVPILHCFGDIISSFPFIDNVFQQSCVKRVIMPPIVKKGAISIVFVRLSVCLSVTYIANNSRTQRPSVPKFGRKVPYLRCDSHTRFNVKWWKIRLEAVGGIPCRPNPSATLLIAEVICGSGTLNHTHSLTHSLWDIVRFVWLRCLSCQVIPLPDQSHHLQRQSISHHPASM